jgi:hypothetical protein
MKIINMRRPKGLSILSFGILAVALAGLIAACEPKANTPGVNTPPATSPSPVAPASPAVSPTGSPAADVKPSAKVESMVGKWNGPEGTYLNITKKGTGYEVEVKNLDSAKKFDGIAKGDTIEFTRNGKTETVKSANGAETGMKGFEKETNCLVITKGSEGFCKKQ